MNSSWLIPMYLGFGGFSGSNTFLCSCMYISDYNRYSKKYEKYGVDE